MSDNVEAAPSSDVEFWDKWHTRRLDRAPRQSPSKMAYKFASELPKRPCALLELGYGDAVDLLHFAALGHSVSAVEIAPTAAVRARMLPQFEDFRDRVRLHESSLSDLSRFTDAQFDGVFSELALHYFEGPETAKLFSDLKRVCRVDGLLGFSVKSTSDPLYGLGVEIDTDMYYYNGHRRHFFSIDYAAELLSEWRILYLGEEKGSYDSDGKENSFVRALAQRV